MSMNFLVLVNQAPVPQNFYLIRRYFDRFSCILRQPPKRPF